MKAFENRTNDGNEPAIRRGKVVPPDGINLAWAKSPTMTPRNNVVVIDTSQTVEENSNKDIGGRKIYYANSIGVLEDVYGNQYVSDEFPVVSDVFLKDEDFSTVPAEEYIDDDVLSFMHVSRHFHVDHPGLVLPGDLFPYKTEKIKVVDSDNNEYTSPDGSPRYKVKIFSAYTTDTSAQGAYRVHVYVDTDTNEDLYLTYNKIEIGEDGLFKNSETNFKELLNPISYYEYTPEESEVVDPANREKLIYSTRPTALKEQVLGTPSGTKDGFKVYVPKKAVPDPRSFQTFRWRVNCTFNQKFKVDPSSPEGIRCGVVRTNAYRSPTPYVFLNLSRSQHNATGVRFYNPLSEGGDDSVTSDSTKEMASYWEVNFDTVSYDDLKKFDVLIWSPPFGVITDMNKYSSKIDYFTKDTGGYMIFDTNNKGWIRGFGVRSTPPVGPSGWPTIASDSQTGYAYTRIPRADDQHELFHGALAYGGWTFNDDTRIRSEMWDNISWYGNVFDEYITMTYYYKMRSTLVHFFRNVPGDWETLYELKTQTDISRPRGGNDYPTIISKKMDVHPQGSQNLQNASAGDPIPPSERNPNPSGRMIMSTMGVVDSANMLINYTVEGLFDLSETNVVDFNRGETLAQYDDYRLYINSPHVEGAYKFLMNVCLSSLRYRPLDSSDEVSYSTNFSATTPWKSSWVIDGDVLSENERAKNDFFLLPTDEATPAPEWQRRLSNKTLEQLINDAMTGDMKARVEGAEREYTIEVSNSKVKVPVDTTSTTVPHAWTYEYSPTFQVPVELGPHIIRSEDVKAHYQEGDYIAKSYPAKPYNAHVRVDYFDTEESDTKEIVRWTVHGTVTETITTGTYIPPSSTTKESEIQLSWAEHGTGDLNPSSYLWRKDMPSPDGITTWQNANYYNSAWGTGNRNYPSYGLYVQLTLGSRGEVVKWVQDCMNVFQYFGYFHYGELALDGYYGNRTAACIVAFQEAMGCSRVTAITDAETLSIIGHLIIAINATFDNAIYKTRSNSGWSRFYFWPRTRIRTEYISDNNRATAFSKRSWITDGPSVIWDLFMVEFEQQYNIHGVTLVPDVDGDTKSIMFRSIDVRKQPFSLRNYDSRSGNPIWMPYRPTDGKSIYVPFSPRRGDTLIVGIGQDGPSGWGTSRVMGVRDVRAHARVKTTTLNPGVNTIRKQTVERPVTITDVSVVNTGKIKIRLPLPKPSSANAVVNKVVWNSVTTDNQNVITELVDTFGQWLYIANARVDGRVTAATAYGKKIPSDFSAGNRFFWMDPDTREVSKQPETGWISRIDGVKVLCTSAGNPVGFPASIPSLAAAADEQQRHYSSLSIESIGNDATVQVGFYDTLRKEFITDIHGEPRMTFIEYITRGRNNVYVAVVSTYEVETVTPIPAEDDAPPIPNKWAMPVYGLYSRTGSKIGIGSLPDNMGQDDHWPIPIKTGKFDRKIRVPVDSSGIFNGTWIGSYQGHTITAHYSIPEAENADWSQIWGPPYVDIVGETPEILDSSTLQIHQPPFLHRRVPTHNRSMADPVRPVFKLYGRDSVDGEWAQVPMSDIKDYNVSTGEIHLDEPMSSSDPSLWKVDYTTQRRDFFFKGGSYQGDSVHNNLIDLNPYSKLSWKYSHEPTYVYVLPSHVRVSSGGVIASSLLSRTIYLTNDPSIFEPTSPRYNILAIRIGVIYISTALDVSDLAVLDTRSRGGGAPANAALEEIKRITQDASSFWDMNANDIRSYQKSGFVIVRLPAMLKGIFTEEQIRETIAKNITAGVMFKIEDLSGEDWS